MSSVKLCTLHTRNWFLENPFALSFQLKQKMSKLVEFHCTSFHAFNKIVSFTFAQFSPANSKKIHFQLLALLPIFGDFSNGTPRFPHDFRFCQLNKRRLSLVCLFSNSIPLLFANHIIAPAKTHDFCLTRGTIVMSALFRLSGFSLFQKGRSALRTTIQLSCRKGFWDVSGFAVFVRTFPCEGARHLQAHFLRLCTLQRNRLLIVN